MRTKAFIGAAATLATAALLPAAAPAGASSATPTPSGQVTVNLVQVNGSGCRPGSASVAVSPDNTAFTVTYSEYLAQVGKGAKPVDFRKNCQLGLRVNVPQGYTYAVVQADYRGFLSLERGASATQKASYYFQGMAGTDRRSQSFWGPRKGDWQVSDRTGIEALVYAPCGTTRNFNINTELLVNGGNSDTERTNSFMAMDSTDGSFNTKYHFAWKQCPVR
ncbi:hypothetical protein GCM10010329_43600 [Streptomyces spiroverticillatus]|uniref:DUF4360 domain-containing protein n=1 Tax=Streptomyces finlayi TaxID=67296 RepID=A0A919CAI7_9ACTN|nr:DUF4360 domain-containing protein [Streptomyces finlayi]GHA15830.1 hypothetical protein GCM10010329_43600 [Streptomyces spiroverticillatus]GHC96467.1 hypothetical protein GCM10010334_36640 [Streptomyces finlayi]